jgi:heme/copper-type cytochrome/quinol oxidase subunit 2
MLSDEELGELLEKKKKKESVITPYRLLTVDNFVYLPIQKNIRVLVSSTDVLHS